MQKEVDEAKSWHGRENLQRTGSPYLVIEMHESFGFDFKESAAYTATDPENQSIPACPMLQELGLSDT